MFDHAASDYDAAYKHDATDAGSLYARGMGKLKKGDVAGGSEDVAKAEAMQANISAVYAGYRLR